VRWREGVGTLWNEAGIRALVIDSPTLAGARSAFTLDGDVSAVPPEQVGWDQRRGWCDPREVHRAAEGGRPLPLAVLARDPAVSEPVWSGLVGYPGDPAYQEFHKRHDVRGHRYWRVTGPGVDLGDKAPYDPHAAADRVAAHVAHFCEVVRRIAAEHHARTGRDAVITAPFDAELFGHWWHEGPDFLLGVTRALAADPEIRLRTMSEVAGEPCDKAVSLPEGTWGAGGDHRVWLNDELRFYWEWAYRSEDRFLDLWDRAGWRTDPVQRALLAGAARELLLLQASDWAFVIGTRGAVDYGIRRIAEHAARFDTLCNGVVDAMEGKGTDPVVAATAALASTVDDLFADLDLEAWAPT
jgi:1,4-alpha-glucan branching enzyme